MASDPPTDLRSIIHGYQPTDVRCPYCGDMHGMRYRAADGMVVYVCWCGAKKREDPSD